MTGLILPFEDKTPKIADSAFIAPTAVVIGDVMIGADSSIWYGCTLRGDVNHIRIGARSNIQDHSVIHVDRRYHPAVIGDDVLVGHMCLIHGCTLEDGCFVGMKATIMDGCVVESGGMVAAGALLTPGKRVKRGELWAGSPAKPMRDLTAAQIEEFRLATDHYARLAAKHKAACLAQG